MWPHKRATFIQHLESLIIYHTNYFLSLYLPLHLLIYPYLSSRILVASDMVKAIIGNNGAPIRMITQITKAGVDVQRKENLGTAEKVIIIS